MDATRRLLKRLSKFESEWLRGKADPNDPLLDFYDSPQSGEPLKRNMRTVTEHCFLLGYFAFVSNDDADLEAALDIYKLRNEAEVVFKLMLGNLMKTTRVHSTQALEGLLFTTFVALSILTNLRARMKADLNGQPVCANYTIAEVFARLKKIQLIEIEGKNAVLMTLYVSPLSLTCEIKQGTDDLKETVEPIYSDDGKESIAPEVTLQSGETIGAADRLFLITKYLDKRGRYCFRMDEILDPETVSSVSAFGETFSVE